MQNALGVAGGSSRLAALSVEETPFWKSAKHRQSVRKNVHEDTTHSDDDDAVKSDPVKAVDGTSSRGMRGLARQNSSTSKKSAIKAPPSQEEDNSDVAAASTSNANYHRRERPVRSLSRSASAGPEPRASRKLEEDAGDFKEDGEG